MRRPTTWFLVLTVVCLASSNTAEAAPILSVDFQHAGQPSGPAVAAGVTQAGFQAFTNVGANSASDMTTFATIAGDIDVTISGKHTTADGMFTRGGVSNAGSLTFADIYNDFAFNNTNNPPGNAMTLTLSGVGITANTDYYLTFWSYDDDSSGNHSVAFTGAAGTSGSASPIVYTPGVDPTSNLQYATTGTFTSNGLGVLTIAMLDTITGATGNTGIRLNAFQLSAVPEPSAWLLLICGTVGIGLLLRRRNR